MFRSTCGTPTPIPSPSPRGAVSGEVQEGCVVCWGEDEDLEGHVFAGGVFSLPLPLRVPLSLPAKSLVLGLGMLRSACIA